jgi:hypothetical protein
MATRTGWWLAGLAAAGLTTVPVSSSAQCTRPPAAAQSYGQSSAENKSPRYHLQQAERALDELSRSAGISTSSSTGSGATGGTTGSGTTGSGTTGGVTGSMASGSGDLAANVGEIRRHFDALKQAYERAARDTATGGSTGSGTTGSGTTGSGTTGSGTGTGTMGSQSGISAAGDSWMTHYSRLNQALDRLDVPKTSTGSLTSGSSAASGTTGAAAGSGTTGSGTTASRRATGSASGSIDASTMARLREFRMHLDNFHAAAMAERVPK